ncbi:MAG: hypothetical protein P8107_11240, partial [Spirochaetia bacterium]
WIEKNAYGPHSNVTRFFSNGTYAGYNDYAETQQFFGGIWKLEGDILEADSIPFEITKINNNHYSLAGLGTELQYYRKGYEPDGCIFSNPITVLSAGNWSEGSIDSKEEVNIYAFTATNEGNHTIEGDDADGSGFYGGDVIVTVYASDQQTLIFEEEDFGYDMDALPLYLPNDAIIYIIVEQTFTTSSGSYAIRVKSP